MLGEKQSGHLTSIGFDLYCKLLDENIKKVRGQVEQTALIVKKALNVFIPNTYIVDDRALSHVPAIVKCSKSHGFKKVAVECKDRHGPSLNEWHHFLLPLMCS